MTGSSEDIIDMKGLKGLGPGYGAVEELGAVLGRFENVSHVVDELLVEFEFFSVHLIEILEFSADLLICCEILLLSDSAL